MIATTGQGVSAGALESLAAAGQELAGAGDLDDALSKLAAAAASATSATFAVIRVADAPRGVLHARAVWARSGALRAELEGSQLPIEEVGDGEVTDPDELPEALARLATRAGASAVLLCPVSVGGRTAASLEVGRAGEGFSETETLLARLIANYGALLVRAAGSSNGSGAEGERPGLLDLAGRALAAVAEEARTAERIARLAVEVTGARSCVLWRSAPSGPEPLAAVGAPADLANPADAVSGADEALEGRGFLVVDSVVLIPLGQPAVGGLRLVFPDTAPSGEELVRLAAFGSRAAHALRASERTSGLTGELDRSRALIAVVGQAISELSLSHTLETAVDGVADLLGADRAAVYLRQGGELEAAAERGLVGPHLRVADALLALMLGSRARTILEIRAAGSDQRLAEVHDAVAEAGIEAAVAVPLRAAGELIGLLVAYLPSTRPLHENETALLAALAGQLAVAVQNAGLHEETARLARDREHALHAERLVARRLEAFYEISRSFSESLSLEETIGAVTRTAVELLDVDAAVLRMPDPRGDALVPRAVHVAEPRLAGVIEPLLDRPHPADEVEPGPPVLLTRAHAGKIAAHELLQPFIERGSTAALVPIVHSGEVMATLTLVSLDPARPIDADTLEATRSFAAQAALAIDNARLYQQQAHFADAMQQSLLPAEPPRIPGLDVGSVYESSARLDVGGDIFDFTRLGSGRLAVVVGDVTGKGIDAAADMAMAKFVFRTLTREHPEPPDFLRFANEVVLDEIGEAKFITMLYLTVDPETGELGCGGAGHPEPRLVRPDGSVMELGARGLALGIAPNQQYPEARTVLEPGAAVVLFTDGVVESRRDGELYGQTRLDRLLSEQRHLPAVELARAVVEDSRAFGGGGLLDDCAVVVVKRTDS